MDRLFKDRTEIGLADKDKGKAVEAVEMDIHDHLNIPKDAGREILAFIDGQEKCFTLLLQQMKEAFLNVSEHHRLFGAVVKAEFEAKLMVELGNTDRR